MELLMRVKCEIRCGGLDMILRYVLFIQFEKERCPHLSFTTIL